MRCSILVSRANRAEVLCENDFAYPVFSRVWVVFVLGKVRKFCQLKESGDDR
ncbi:Uncharacterised protein [Mycobacteroides abscessus subsp. massiliense]|nr:Uncharacterised protein [Mycobacteroides abscessus subsp. massiliense]